MIVKGMTIDDETTPVTNYVYAHGQLEKDCGYDLVYIPKFGTRLDDVDPGIYNVEFVYPDNTTTDAKLFIWEANFGGIKVKKGLVVKNDDDSHLKEAEHYYKTKKESI